MLWLKRTPICYYSFYFAGSGFRQTTQRNTENDVLLLHSVQALIQDNSNNWEQGTGQESLFLSSQGFFSGSPHVLLSSCPQYHSLRIVGLLTPQLRIPRTSVLREEEDTSQVKEDLEAGSTSLLQCAVCQSRHSACQDSRGHIEQCQLICSHL